MVIFFHAAFSELERGGSCGSNCKTREEGKGGMDDCRCHDVNDIVERELAGAVVYHRDGIVN
jgi:hypothetical protein